MKLLNIETTRTKQINKWQKYWKISLKHPKPLSHHCFSQRVVLKQANFYLVLAGHRNP